MVNDLTDQVQPAALGLSLAGKPLPVHEDPISAPIGTTPLRRPHSVRRTMSINTTWPDGAEGVAHYIGRARDMLTWDAVQEPKKLAEVEVDIASVDRQIRAIRTVSEVEGIERLVGAKAGGQLRSAIAEAMPQEKVAGSPLYAILDDMAGATLVSRWAFAPWRTANTKDTPRTLGNRKVEGVCIGFRPGASSLDENGQPQRSGNQTRVVPLPNPLDPAGWHALPHQDGVHFRRARRIDVWFEGGELAIESHFQDSASTPDGGNRWAIHEYLLEARVAPDGRIRSLVATPGTLPYASCRAAPVNNEVLIGTPVGELRETVLEKLKFTAGCTHLNDALRSLAEAEILAAHLNEA